MPLTIKIVFEIQLLIVIKKSEEADDTLKNDEMNVNVQANNHELPERLERVLDVLETSISPQPLFPQL
ncbi:hypothetical protein A9CBEGH2_22110 [Amedibacterium intestinale]|nr:hypothetical protein A9CBEGH2_22110 [Amedibacterium intestinale]